jgi:HPt (histidine-containing phosphotransfer) domain-containing protein
LRQTTDQLAQIREAIDAQQPEQVSRVAHSCAGASATCGMVAVLPLLRQLEQGAAAGDLSSARELFQAVTREFHRIRGHLETHSATALEPKASAL